MKILIQDYSSRLSTEPQYLGACLHQAGQEVHMWTKDTGGNYQPIFDVFNRVKPDLFILHVNKMDEDVIKSIAKFDTKVCLNVSDSPIDIQSIEETLSSLNIKNVKLFSNNLWTKHVEVLLPAFDPFLPTVKHFSIPFVGVSMSDLEEAKLAAEEQEVYHLVNFGSDAIEGFDFTHDINLIGHLNNYDKAVMHLPGDVCCSQVFFQSTIRANKLSIKPTDKQELFNEFLEFAFEPEETTKSVEAVVKSQIAKKHTSFNRAKQLLNIWNFEEAKLFDDVIQKIGEANE